MPLRQREVGEDAGNHSERVASLNVGYEQSSLGAEVWNYPVAPLRSEPGEDGESNLTKLHRVAQVVGKGIELGAKEELLSIYDDPSRLLKGVGISTLMIAGIAVHPSWGKIQRCFPSIMLASAAVDVAPHINDVSTGINNAWKSGQNNADSIEKVSSIGHMAVDYGVAKFTWNRTMNALKPWAVSVANRSELYAPKVQKVQLPWSDYKTAD